MNLIFQLKELEKKSKRSPKVAERKIRAEVNDLETKNTEENINESKSKAFLKVQIKYTKL